MPASPENQKQINVLTLVRHEEIATTICNIRVLYCRVASPGTGRVRRRRSLCTPEQSKRGQSGRQAVDHPADQQALGQTVQIQPLDYSQVSNRSAAPRREWSFLQGT